MDRRLTAAVTVRRAKPRDETFVVGLAGRFAETKPGWRGENEVTVGTERELRRAFRNPSGGSAVFVAEDVAGSPIGFAYVVLHEDFFTGEMHGHLSELAVTADGSGAGGALIAAVETHVRELGIRFVTLNVNVDNVRARSIYERFGYAAQVVQMVKVLTT